MSGFTESVEGRQVSPAWLYHQNSCLNEARRGAFLERILEVGTAGGASKSPTSLRKTLPLKPQVPLPRKFLITTGVERIIRKRRTRRDFSGLGISLGNLGRILRGAYGVTGVSGEGPDRVQLRASPSAGATYPLELYVAIVNGKGVQPGLYHYNGDLDTLERLVDGDLRQSLNSSIAGMELIGHYDAALLITSVPERTMSKYGERGYRFILIEVGHLAQNVILVSEALGMSSVCMGGFYEDSLAEMIGCDRRFELVQYVILLGRR